MRTQRKRSVVLNCGYLVLFSLLVGCVNNIGEPDSDQQAPVPSQIAKNLTPHVLATVNGTPILDTQVLALIELADQPLGIKEALDILVRTELLAQEAARRGFDTSPDVTQARTVELAHAIFNKEIVDKFHANNLDQETLKKFYNKNKPRFVHDTLRRVVHFLAHTGKGQFDDKQALEVATHVADIARDVKSEDAFKSVVKTVNKKEENSGKTRLESLSPFEEKNKRYAGPFVKATFAIPKVGQISPPSKTMFGWHVIYFAEEIPPKNESFEDVKMQLAEELLPQKRTFEAGHLFQSIYEKSDIFIYEDTLQDGVAKP